MQTYSDPTRESDPHALPDIEVFFMSAGDFQTCGDDTWMSEAMNVAVNERGEDASTELAGWYWQSCFPGCLPDSDPIGPFETAAEAEADAQDF